MAREDLHFRLRIPEGLKEKIEKASDANLRSMTAEIVARLERSFDEDELQGVEERLSDLETQVADLSREADKRFDRVEDRVWRLLEHAGLYDPNPD